MKATILTTQNVPNYGALLQAYATQQLLEGMGCRVDFFNYYIGNARTPWQGFRRIRYCQNPLRWAWQVLVRYPSYLWFTAVCRRFVQRRLHVQTQVVGCYADFKQLPLDSDIYLLGSDQLWNTRLNGGLLPELFLAFVPDGKVMASFSTSLGAAALTKWEQPRFKRLLERFDLLSLREESGVEAIRRLGYPEAVQLNDPTLQLPAACWRSLCRRPYPRPYILIYQLFSNPRMDAYAAEYARRRGLPLLRICRSLPHLFLGGRPVWIPRVEEFLSYIAYAELVITDSFHGTAFSIHFHRPFLSVYPQFHARIESLLRQTGLEHRHLSRYDDFSFLEEENVDFTAADQALEANRQACLRFLQRMVDMA